MMKRIVLFVAGAVALLALILVNSSGFVVKTGNVGLVVNHYTGKIDSRIRHAGFNLQSPLSGNELIEVPTYDRTYTMVKDSSEGAHPGDDSVLVNTSSGNTLHVDTSITYHIAGQPQHPEYILALYRKYRNQFRDWPSFEEIQLRPAFRQAIVDAFGTATTSQNMTGDGKQRAAAYALKQLNDRFRPDAITIDEVRVRAIYPDDATVAVLRSRLQAQQNLKLAQLDQQLQGLLNQKKVLKAEAEAQAQQVRAASLTPRLVKFKHLKNLEIVAVPRGTMVNVGSTAGP
ncbi:MAG: hypothetical protein LC772_06965 [Chloroflexi bacterium]|nr:hypothetical protein [Chloroflexota bacterium]